MDLSKVYDPEDDDTGRSELDSHADTCVAGSNTVPLWYTDHKVSVSPFIGEYQPLEDIPVASVATAWDDPKDGSTIILIINEALYFGDRMPHTLLCPNQLRYNGLIVNDAPRMFDPNSTQSIIIPGKLELPLKMRGILMYLATRRPTEQELSRCDRYELMSAINWEPNSVGTEFNNIAGVSAHLSKGDPLELREDFASRVISSIVTHPNGDLNGDPTPHEADVIAHAKRITRELFSISQGNRRMAVTEDQLAARWYIGKEAAARTLNATTQEGLRYVEGPLERRLKTNQAHLCFPTLYTRMYSDSLFGNIKSIRGYTCAQLFTDGHGFSRVYPMKSKGDAHHALMQFIHEVGVPKDLLTDGAPEEMRGEWGRIVRQYHIHQRITEPKSPWQN